MTNLDSTLKIRNIIEFSTVWITREASVHDNSELKKILILLTTPTKEHLKEIIYYI